MGAVLKTAGFLVLLQAYLWEDNKTVVEWLSQQLDECNWQRSLINENIKCVQRDYIMEQIKK